MLTSNKGLSASISLVKARFNANIPDHKANNRPQTKSIKCTL